MGPVVSLELRLRFLDMGAHRLLAELERLGNLREWLAERQGAQNCKLTRCERRGASQPVCPGRDDSLQADGRERRTHDEHCTGLWREALREDMAGPEAQDPSSTHRTRERVSDAVLQRELEWPPVMAERLQHPHQLGRGEGRDGELGECQRGARMMPVELL